MEYKERLPSPPKTEKSPPAAGQKGKPKGSKPEKGSKDKASENKGSRPSSQQFDLTKPHWSLRVVIDAGAAVSQGLICPGYKTSQSHGHYLF